MTGTSQDHYAVLGVAPNASAEEIKRAYRRLIRDLHPDTNPDAEAEAQAKAVNWAYDVLSDTVKRKFYDENPASGGDPAPNPLITCSPSVVDFGDVEIEGHYKTLSARIYFDPKQLSADDDIVFDPEYGKFWRVDSLREPEEGEEDYDRILYDINISTDLQPDVSVGLQSEKIYFLIDKKVVCELPLRVNVIGMPAAGSSDTDDSTLRWTYRRHSKVRRRHRAVWIVTGLLCAILFGTLIYSSWPVLRQTFPPPEFPYNSIQKHNQDVVAVAVSSKRVIASASLDGTIMVSEPNGSNEQTVLADLDHVTPTSVSFSADGEYLAVGYTNGEVVILDPSTTNRRGHLVLPSAIADVAFSPVAGDETLAVATSDKGNRGSVALLAISSQGAVSTKEVLPTNAFGVSLAYSPDARYIAAVVKPTSMSGEIQLWDVPERRKIASIADGSALSASFSPRGHILAIADDTTVRFWDMQKSAVVQTIHHLPIGTIANNWSGPHMIAYSSSDSSVVAFVTSTKDSLGTTIEFFDTVQDRQLALLSSGGYVYTVAFNPLGGLFSTGGGAGNASPGYGDNAVHVWNLAKIDD